MSERYAIPLEPSLELTPEELKRSLRLRMKEVTSDVDAILVLRWIVDNVDELVTRGIDSLMKDSEISGIPQLSQHHTVTDGIILVRALLEELLESDLSPVDLSLKKGLKRQRELKHFEKLLDIHLNCIGYKLDEDK